MRIGDFQFFQPTRATYDDPALWNLEPVDVWFTTEDSLRLHGWWFRAKGETAGIVIHCHGYRGNVSGAFPCITWLLDEGFDVLCFDYRGYGESDGCPSRVGLIRDVRAAIEFTTGRAHEAKLPVYLFGQSLGGAVGVIAAADRDDLAGIVTDGTFTDFRVITADTIQRSVGARWIAEMLAWMLVSPGPSAVASMPDVRCPVLVMAGKRDRIVHTDHARKLYDASAGVGEIWIDEAGGHCNSIKDENNPTRRVMIDFLRKTAKMPGCENRQQPQECSSV